MKLTPPHFILSSPHSLSFFSYLTIFPPRHGQPNTFIIFCSTNKAVHWSEVLTPHNDPLSESHCSYTQDNYSTLQVERGNYWERCSSRVNREEQKGLGQGSCGCIVYWGRWSNKGAQLRQDAGRQTWCWDTNAEEKLRWPSSLFILSKITVDAKVEVVTTGSVCLPVQFLFFFFFGQGYRLIKILEVGGLCFKREIASGKTKWSPQQMCAIVPDRESFKEWMVKMFMMQKQTLHTR